MRTWTIGQIGAAAGVAFIVLNVVGGFIAGSPPGTDESPAKIADFFHDHHRAVVIGAILTGLASPLFLALLAGLALRLRAVGQGAAGVLVFALGVVGAALGTASDAMYGSLARIGVEGDTGLAQGVYQLSGFVTAKAFWFAAGFALVTGWAAWWALPRWYALTSLVASVLLALGGISLKSSGFLAPLGAMAWIAFLSLLVWVLATCLLVWREPAGAATPAAAPV